MTLLDSLKADLLQALKLLGIIRATMNRDKLYETARSLLGRDASPQDIADDEVGCAETLSYIIRKAFPELKFPMLVSTRTLYYNLITSPSFTPVSEPEYGDIVISVTGTGNGRVKNGHCGVVGRNDGPDGTPWIISNNSYTGTLEVTHTLAGWRRFYETRGGMQTHFIRVN